MAKRSEKKQSSERPREERRGEKKPVDLKPPKDKADAVKGGPWAKR